MRITRASTRVRIAGLSWGAAFVAVTIQRCTVIELIGATAMGCVCGAGASACIGPLRTEGRAIAVRVRASAVWIVNGTCALGRYPARVTRASTRVGISSFCQSMTLVAEPIRCRAVIMIFWAGAVRCRCGASTLARQRPIGSGRRRPIAVCVERCAIRKILRARAFGGWPMHITRTSTHI